MAGNKIFQNMAVDLISDLLERDVLYVTYEDSSVNNSAKSQLTIFRIMSSKTRHEEGLVVETIYPDKNHEIHFSLQGNKQDWDSDILEKLFKIIIKYAKRVETFQPKFSIVT